VKPIENLERVRMAILDKIQAGNTEILLIGAGPAGVELTGNILRLVRDHGAQAQVKLASATQRILPNTTQRAACLAEHSLLQRGAQIFPNFIAKSMGAGYAYSHSGDEIAYDIAILTIGIVPSDVFTVSGLKTSEDGALLVTDFLHSEAHPEIFGGGDCIAIQGKSLPRIGVYAVREGPILFQNLLARLTAKPLVAFKPQKRYLLILNLGDGTGIFVRRPFAWDGKLAFVLKNFIDIRFVLKFQS
jgi:NADH dehydrogenase FAD-containing subunit